MPPFRRFHFPPGHDAKRWIRELTDQYSVREGRTREEKISFYDTFDWRLFRQSLVLYRSGDRLVLRKLHDPRILFHAVIDSPPVFLSDLPDGGLKKRLGPIVQVRALGNLADTYSRKTPYRIASRRKKPVARLVHEEYRFSCDADALPRNAFLWWEPHEESPRASRILENALKQAGFTPAEREDIFFAALESAGRKPGDYSSKMKIALRPDMRSEEATKTVLRSLLRVIRINEAHIGKDLDTEYLHDFRVAIRRTRSALGRMKKVFPREITDRFRKDLSYVGKLSNELRDLDVHLLNEETYRKMLPESMRADIGPLFVHLREKRSKVFRGVIREIQGEKYRNIMDGWEAFLDSKLEVYPKASDAAVPIRDLARRKIYKKYQRILKEGSRILENQKDEELHALRIQCKELRYLLEFFSSLFPGKTIRTFVGQLKKLQDILGAFNDYGIQVRYLTRVSEELPATIRRPDKTAAAIGLLIETLGGEREKAKEAFSDTFTEYASPPNRRAFREAFASKGRASIDNGEGRTDS